MKKLQRPSADQTRNIILKVSRKLFAKKGFSGTSIGDIAKMAKINQSLIYHHFSDKIGLWKAVKLQAIDAYMQRQDHADLSELSLQQFLERIIRQRIEVFNDNPDILKILHWQELEPNAGSLMSVNVGSCTDWVCLVKKMQELKKLRTDLDPYLIVSLISSATKCAHRDGPGEFNMFENNRQEKYIQMSVDCLANYLEAK